MLDQLLRFLFLMKVLGNSPRLGVAEGEETEWKRRLKRNPSGDLSDEVKQSGLQFG